MRWDAANRANPLLIPLGTDPTLGPCPAQIFPCPRFIAIQKREQAQVVLPCDLIC
jgi:hypothetical protein